MVSNESMGVGPEPRVSAGLIGQPRSTALEYSFVVASRVKVFAARSECADVADNHRTNWTVLRSGRSFGVARWVCTVTRSVSWRLKLQRMTDYHRACIHSGAPMKSTQNKPPMNSRS